MRRVAVMVAVVICAFLLGTAVPEPAARASSDSKLQRRVAAVEARVTALEALDGRVTALEAIASPGHRVRRWTARCGK
jgi:hypothetical protein